MSRRFATLVLMLAAPVLAHAQSPSAAQPPSITVSGTAVVRVVPDEVAIDLRIESLDKDLRKSVANTDARVQKLLALTRESKIEPSCVQTSFVNIRSRWSDNGHTFEGYESSSGITVSLQDLSKYSEFMARAIDAAQALVDGIDFRSTKSAEKRTEARRMALQAARAKATAMAWELGQTAGRPLSIEEEPVHSWGRVNYGANVQVSDESGGGQADVTTVAPGQIEVSARVKVKFELLAPASTTQPVKP